MKFQDSHNIGQNKIIFKWTVHNVIRTLIKTFANIKRKN